MSVPATVIYFSIYDHLKYMYGYNEKDPNTKYIPAVAGSAARGKRFLYSYIEKGKCIGIDERDLLNECLPIKE